MKKLLGLLTIFVLVLAGCGGKDENKTFIYPTKEVESMNILSVTYSQTFQMLSDVFTGLMQVNAEGETVPGIAKSVDKSDDGLTYTFHLRDDAVWFDNNGEEKAKVTAKDFEYAWKKQVDPKSSSSYAYIFDVIKNGKAISAGEKDVNELGVKATDDTTLVVNLEYVAPYFENLVTFGAFYPIPEEGFKEFGEDWGQTEATTWYDGAYYPTSYDKATSIMLTKAPLYFDADSVKLPAVEYRKVEDMDLMYNSFQSGELSKTEFPSADEYKQAQEDGTIHDKLTGYMFYLAMNQQEGPTANPTFRKALAYAIDRDSISKANAGQIPVEYFVPEGLTPGAYDGKEYRDSAEKSYITYDPEKAKEYLKQYMDEEGITDASSIKLKYLTNDASAAKNTATAVQANLKQVLGVTVDVDIQPQTSYVEKRSANDYDLLLGGWGADYADPLSYLGIANSANIGSYNPGGYDNPEFDKAIDAAAKIQDTDERFAAFAKLEKQLITDDNVIIPVYQKDESYLIDENYSLGYDLFNKISFRFADVKE